MPVLALCLESEYMCLVMVSQDFEYRGLVMVIQGSQYAGLVKVILGSGHMHSLTVSQDSVTWSKLLCHSWLSWSSWSNLRPLACIHLCMQLAPAAALSLHSAFHVLLLISLSTVAAICLVICVGLRSASSSSRTYVCAAHHLPSCMATIAVHLVLLGCPHSYQPGCHIALLQ